MLLCTCFLVYYEEPILLSAEIGMKASELEQKLEHTITLPAQERHAALSALHTAVLECYLDALQAISAERAAQTVSETDPRTISQLVGHIAAWEQFAIQAAGQILGGVLRPRIVSGFDGFADADGHLLNFADVDAFNARSTRLYADWPWEDVRALAIDTAKTFHTLFTHPNLLTAEKLEATEQAYRRNENGEMVPGPRMGWSLWGIFLSHPMAEHAEALGMRD